MKSDQSRGPDLAREHATELHCASLRHLFFKCGQNTTSIAVMPATCLAGRRNARPSVALEASLHWGRAARMRHLMVEKCRNHSPIFASNALHEATERPNFSEINQKRLSMTMAKIGSNRPTLTLRAKWLCARRIADSLPLLRPASPA